MALDALALGPFLFTDFAVPDQLPGGGKHQLKVHKLPGGDRIVDAMGPDDDNRQFTVIHVGSRAQSEVDLLDQLRIAGQPLPYSNGMEARTVVIESFTWHLERFNVIHSTISLLPVDNPAGVSGVPASLDSLIGSDLSSASATAAANVEPVTTPINNPGGIGAA